MQWKIVQHWKSLLDMKKFWALSSAMITGLPQTVCLYNDFPLFYALHFFYIDPKMYWILSLKLCYSTPTHVGQPLTWAILYEVLEGVDGYMGSPEHSQHRNTVTLIPLKSVSVCNTSLSAYFTVARPPWALFDMSPQEPNISPLWPIITPQQVAPQLLFIINLDHLPGGSGWGEGGDIVRHDRKLLLSTKNPGSSPHKNYVMQFTYGSCPTAQDNKLRSLVWKELGEKYMHTCLFCRGIVYESTQKLSPNKTRLLNIICVILTIFSRLYLLFSWNATVRVRNYHQYS